MKELDKKELKDVEGGGLFLAIGGLLTVWAVINLLTE